MALMRVWNLIKISASAIKSAINNGQIAVYVVLSLFMYPSWYAPFPYCTVPRNEPFKHGSSGLNLSN